MHISVRVVLVTLASTLLLANAVSTTFAGRLEVSSQQIRATWSSFELGNIITGTARCKVTLEGSFHSRTIRKVERSLIGAITRFNVTACTNGRVTAGTQVPLGHLTYESFSGTLPNITTVGFLLSRFAVLFEVQEICNGIYGSLDTDNISLAATREAGGSITSVAPVAGRNILSFTHDLGSPAFCPTTVTVNGSGRLTVLNGTALVTVRLI